MQALKTRIDTVRTHHDARGSLFEPVDDLQLAGKRNVHVVLTAPGCVRGNHRHLVGTEISVVTGPALVRLKEDGELHDVHVPADETWRFTVPPGVAHAYRNTGSAVMVLIGFNTELHDPARPDAVRDEIL
jgi:UDP-2-acetamido-2,6-beta-L-arabino-hexul-4-ose reductase